VLPRRHSACWHGAPAPLMVGWRSAAAAALIGLLGEAHAQEAAGETAHVVVNTLPAMERILTSYLSAPVDGAAALTAQFELGGLRGPEAQRAALYAELLATQAHMNDEVHHGALDITMMFIGTESGMFQGYYNLGRFTQRPPGDPAMATDCDWTPFDIATVIEQPINCCRKGGCPFINATTSNLRTFHNTSREVKGRPIHLYGWGDYDPRIRSWYTAAAARVAANPGQMDVGWGEVYLFSSSGNLGVTATSALVDEEGELRGVVGM
jgi:hypothetical protein